MNPKDIRGGWWLRLSAVGFNFYKYEDRLVEDDQLVRGRALASLDAALAKLRAIEAAFRRRYLPPPTRERPSPDPERLQEVQDIEALVRRLSALEVGVRNAAIPPGDATWNRHRDPEETLVRLAEADLDLFGHSSEIEAHTAKLDEGAILGERSALEQSISAAEAALKARQEILTFSPRPVWR